MERSVIGVTFIVILGFAMIAGCGGGRKSSPNSSPTPSTPSGVAVPAPLAEWLFESFESNNSIATSSGSLDLVVGSTNSANNIFSIISGIRGNAVEYNQPEPTGTVSNYYNVKSGTPGQEIFNLRDAITIEMWVKFDRLASEQSNPVTLVNRHASGGYKLYLDNPSNTLKFQINSAVATGSTALVTGNWYHIVGTYDKAVVKIYLNGILDGQTELTGQIADVPSANLKIGGESTGSATKNFKGCLDDTRFYNLALNAEQVNARFTGTDYTGGEPIPDPDVTPSLSPTATAAPTPSPLPTEMPYGGNTHYVTNSSTWTTVMNNLGSGDTIIVTGSYSSGLTMKNKLAAPGQPVVIKPVTPQGTTLYSLEINNCENIIVQEFKFGPNTTGALVKVVNSKYIKILKNIFDHKNVTQSGQCSIVTTQGSDTIEVAYNSFLDKNYGNVSGSYIKTQYDAPNITKNMHIHHNYFYNILPMPAATSGGFNGDSDRETIVFGISASQDIVTNHIVEYNLFEDCDGENEIITVKTSRNIIRYNTFKNCLGSVSVRFGRDTEVYGNFFIGSGDSSSINSPNYQTGGVRVYGINHKVFNNYFRGLTGNSYRIPVLVDSGDTDDSSGGDGHERPTYCEVAFNTIIDCAWGIGLGSNNYSRQPRNCKIGNNIVTGSQNSMITGDSVALNDATNIFEGNIVYPTGSAIVGVTKPDAQVFSINPLLTEETVNGSGLKVLNTGSPAIDYAKGSYNYVTEDFGGQSRSGSLDTGADEYSLTADFSGNKPLSVSDVGPSAY